MNPDATKSPRPGVGGGAWREGEAVEKLDTGWGVSLLQSFQDGELGASGSGP